jgi:ubiquinol-cytochrome c reductase iron-sulfur subunit
VSRRASERAVAVCFLLAAAGAGGFVAAYVLQAGPQALGLCLGVACAALAVGLVLWSAKLLPGGTYVEQREPMAPPRDEQTAFVDTLDRGGAQTPGIVRRTLVLSGLGFLAALVVPLRGLIPSGVQLPPNRELEQTPWRAGRRLVDRDGKPYRATDVAAGTALTVFPEGRTRADDAQAMLVRLDAADIPLMSAETRRRSVSGLLCYSKICTHAGCPVGLYEQTSRQLVCPCHLSVFDVLHQARASNGPAARPLPQLPLDVDADGYVVAAGDFHGQVGPTYWRRG